MTGDEATQLLTAGLPGLPPPWSKQVLEADGPVAVAARPGQRRRPRRRPARRHPDAGPGRIRDQLATAGVTALDVADDGDRNHAVTATLHVSLNRLTVDEQNRYPELAVFGEDVEIPLPCSTATGSHRRQFTDSPVPDVRPPADGPVPAGLYRLDSPPGPRRGCTTSSATTCATTPAPTSPLACPADRRPPEPHQRLVTPARPPDLPVGSCPLTCTAPAWTRN